MAVLAAALLTEASCGHNAPEPELTDAPTVSSTTAAKSTVPQESVTFTLNTAFAKDSVVKVYTQAKGGGASTVVTASISVKDNIPTLTLTKAGGITAGDYWVTVTEPDKVESDRLKLTVSDPA